MNSSTRAVSTWWPKGRKDFTPHTYAAGVAEYLSSYLYRLVFNDNFSQAISSEVASNVGLTHSEQWIHSLAFARPL